MNLVWEVKVSLQRSDDIKREIDIIEEIARLHGFNNFATILPSLHQIGKEDFSYQIRKKITSHFLNEGFNEIITYSLIKLGNNEEISIINSLSKDYSLLRSIFADMEKRPIREGRVITDGAAGLITRVEELAYELRIEEVMTGDVKVVTLDVSMMDVLELFRQARISGAPVVDNDQLVGIVSIEDLIRSLRRGDVEAPVRSYLSVHRGNSTVA